MFTVLPVLRENKSATTHSTQFMTRTEERSILYLYTKFQVDRSIRPTILKLSRDLGHAHLGGHFVVHTQEGSVLYVYTKFEGDSSICSKVIRGSQNFEIGSRDPKPRPLLT